MLLSFLLLVQATSLSTYKGGCSQTNEGLDFSVALKQLQVATWAKSQLEKELFHEQHKQDAKEYKLIATYDWEITELWAKAKKEIDKVMLQFQEDATKQKKKKADKQEDQWALMCDQHNTMFREVLTQVEPADSVRLLTWFFSTTDNFGVASTYSMGEVLAAAMQPRVEVLLTTPLQDSRALMPLCLWHLLC